MGFFRQEYWSGLPFPPPGDLLDPRIEPEPLASPALAGEFFTTVSLGKPLCIYRYPLFFYISFPLRSPQSTVFPVLCIYVSPNVLTHPTLTPSLLVIITCFLHLWQSACVYGYNLAIWRRWVLFVDKVVLMNNFGCRFWSWKAYYILGGTD